MEESNKKILTVSFVLVALITGLVVGILLETFSATFGVVARMMDHDLFRHGLPVFAGFTVFMLLRLNKKWFTYFDEVVIEIKKVVWPSKKDTSAMTVVVCIMLIFSGITLGVFDIFASFFVKFLLNT